MTHAPAAALSEEERAELLTLMDNAGVGLTLIELARDIAVEAPIVSGVTTLLPLAGAMYVLSDGEAPLRVPAGTLALVPAGRAVRLSARRAPPATARSRDHLRRRGGWLTSAPVPGRRAEVQVAAARIGGSRVAALRSIVLVDLADCDVTGPLLTQMIAEVSAGADGNAGFAMALFNACVIHALRRGRAPAAVPASDTGGGWGGAIARAVAAMRAAPGEPHTIDTLAEHVGMSRSTFIRAFARETGSSAQKLLQQVRLEEAAALLGSSGLPIKAIAAMSGFLSRSHFSRTFRGAYGIDPTAYRQRNAAFTVPVKLE